MKRGTQCECCGGVRQRENREHAEYVGLPIDNRMMQCLDCGLCYLEPRPSREKLGTMYRDDAYYGIDNGARGKARLDFYRSKMARLQNWIPHPGKLLSLCCLDGGYALAAARDLGWQVKAIEWSPGMAAHARERLDIDVIESEAWNLDDIPPEQFDAIYSHSFEHMLDPALTLQQLRSRLKPGGILLMEVPNQFDSLKSTLTRYTRRILGPRIIPLPHHRVTTEFHLYYYNVKSFHILLRAHGFEVIDSRTYLPNHPAWLANPRGRWLQNAIYWLGGLIDRGPTVEVAATIR